MKYRTIAADINDKMREYEHQHGLQVRPSWRCLDSEEQDDVVKDIELALSIPLELLKTNYETNVEGQYDVVDSKNEYYYNLLKTYL